MQVNQYSIRFIEKGLAGVSMSMIADKIGIKKPSLYKHFSSKDEIVEAMYQFLREQSKKNANIKPVDFSQNRCGRNRANDYCHQTAILCNGGS